MKLIALGRATGFWKLFKMQNAHSGRNVMPRCLSEGVDIFLKSAEKQGGKADTMSASAKPCLHGLADAMDGVCRRPRRDENRCITFQ